jgi:ribosome-interacting GTPase 1
MKKPIALKKGGSVKDACYHKVKAQYKVFPSAYASGAIAKCRKKRGGKK